MEEELKKALADATRPPRQTRFLRRALLVIQCARELPGARICAVTGQINVELSSSQFEAELRRRYSKSHPDLVFRADSTFERARLDRHRYKHLPRVVLRQGPPPKSERRIFESINYDATPEVNDPLASGAKTSKLRIKKAAMD